MMDQSGLYRLAAVLDSKAMMSACRGVELHPEPARYQLKQVVAAIRLKWGALKRAGRGAN